MSKKRKKMTFVPHSELCDLYDEGYTVQEVADHFKVSTSTVYMALRNLRGLGSSKPTKKAAPSSSAVCGPTFVVDVGLPCDTEVEVKVRDVEGTLKGTVAIQEGGIQYRRPNQKGNGSLLTWETLDKLCQLGLT